MAKSANPVFPIGALAAESGVQIETIRYYEKIGVMPKPARSAGGYRLFGLKLIIERPCKREPWFPQIPQIAQVFH